MPVQQGLYYGGAWRQPVNGGILPTFSPATGEELGLVANADAADADLVVDAAKSGLAVWRDVLPLERAKILREVARLIRDNGDELLRLDAINCGNPVGPMAKDIAQSAQRLEFFAGLVTELKGASIPVGPDKVNFSVREPIGVVARIVAFNHPLQFTASKMAAPLAAGNAVIMKPAYQAPLSALRLAELVGHLFPAGVFNIVPGGREIGEAFASHPGIGAISLVGSVPTGRAVARSAADMLKQVYLELGGKNALIAFPDADPEKVAAAAVAAMNYGWCGQSCGSMSRLFLHDAIHDEVVRRMERHLAKYRPGLPTDPKTTMGSLISREHRDRVLGYIEAGKAEGARLVYGGSTPADPALTGGAFLEPTVFLDVKQTMGIAREEIFGPVQSVLRWSDVDAMLADVNSVEYGLAASIYTNDIGNGHRTAARVQAGYVWINGYGRHVLGAPFGGMKQSGLGREECLGELLAYTEEKNICITFDGARPDP